MHQNLLQFHIQNLLLLHLQFHIQFLHHLLQFHIQFLHIQILHYTNHYFQLILHQMMIHYRSISYFFFSDIHPVALVYSSQNRPSSFSLRSLPLAPPLALILITLILLLSLLCLLRLRLRLRLRQLRLLLRRRPPLLQLLASCI